MATATDALSYTQRGWKVIPVPHRDKNPGFPGWQQLRLTEADVPEHFNGHAQNIGVLLGEPSGWLVDVDLDHRRAIELAPNFLPATPLRFGRASKPESHWLYRVTAPVATKKHRSRSAGMIVELRSTGAQTIFPPSTHESGEHIEFVDTSAHPASVEPDVLLVAIKRLSDAVLVELGERSAPRKPTVHSRRSRNSTNVAVSPDAPVKSPSERSALAMAAMLRMRVADHRDGSLRLFAAACRCIEHGLCDGDALVLLREYARLRPFPRLWNDDEIVQRLSDARKNVSAGAAFTPATEADGSIRLGGRDPGSGRVVLSPKRTLPTAEAYVAEHHESASGRTLHAHAGVLMEWDGCRYIELDDSGAQSRLLPWLHEAVRYAYDRETGEMKLVPFDANPSSVRAALDSIKAHVHLPASLTCPAWLDGRHGPPPDELLVCSSKLVHLRTGQCLEPTSQLYVTNALEFDHDPSAAAPEQWHRFLHQLFDGDVESLELLQEWFGYSLTTNTAQQKMLLIVGPRRSGKGTIARVLRKLVGEGNVCGPMTSSLAGAFGLQPLIGKSVAIISDARFVGESVATVVERLLTISGEDAVSIDRKYLGSVTMKLPTRFVFLTNEFPRLNDASGALAGRFLILRLTESFYGREDIHLTDRLLAELPGILNWAIEGWKRLHDRGHFVMPSSCADAMRDFEELASPVSAFVREMCVIAPTATVWADELYRAWNEWCITEGRTIISSNQRFGRDLSAAFSQIRRRRGTSNRRYYEGIGLLMEMP